MFFKVLEQLGGSLPRVDCPAIDQDQRRALESIQADILTNGPSLGDALDFAYNGDPSLLTGRITQFQGHHIPVQPLLYLYGLGVEGRAPVELIQNHDFIFSAADSQRVLEENFGVEGGVVPLKTVTLKIKSQAGTPMVIPVIGAGDFQWGREDIRSIAESYQPDEDDEFDPAFVPATSSKAIKGCTINPREFDTRLLLGLEPGIVGPFPAAGTMGLFPFQNMSLLRRGEDGEQMVGIAATPFDTICTNLDTLQDIMQLPGNSPVRVVRI